MKRVIFLIFSIGLLCIATQCDDKDCHNVIPFVNNSDKTLYVYKQAKHENDDTLFRIDYWLTEPNSEYKVLPYSTSETCLFMRKKNCYEIWNTIRIFVLDSQVIATTSVTAMKINYMVLRRYDFTPKDLEKLNWNVSYPPTEAMKGMKMYPPYGE